MTFITALLYLLGAVMMMCIADIELRATPQQGGKLLAIFAASLTWPLVMLYVVVATFVDLVLRSLFSPTK